MIEVNKNNLIENENIIELNKNTVGNESVIDLTKILQILEEMIIFYLDDNFNNQHDRALECINNLKKIIIEDASLKQNEELKNDG